MLEPGALRESIVARASIRAEANLSLLLATTNLPRPLREACQRSSMRLGPSPPVVGSTFQGDGGGLFGSSVPCRPMDTRSEEHTSELQSLMRISYAVFCLKKKKRLRIDRTKT